MHAAYLTASRHEKTDGIVPAVSPKMERAKRLELNAAKLETAEPVSVANSASMTDTQLSMHAAELAEIAAAWPGLSREIQAAVVTLIRVSRRDAI